MAAVERERTVCRSLGVATRWRDLGEAARSFRDRLVRIAGSAGLGITHRLRCPDMSWGLPLDECYLVPRLRRGLAEGRWSVTIEDQGEDAGPGGACAVVLRVASGHIQSTGLGICRGASVHLLGLEGSEPARAVGFFALSRVAHEAGFRLLTLASPAPGDTARGVRPLSPDEVCLLLAGPAPGPLRPGAVDGQRLAAWFPGSSEASAESKTVVVPTSARNERTVVSID
jgi:hypothetical protein